MAIAECESKKLKEVSSPIFMDACFFFYAQTKTGSANKDNA